MEETTSKFNINILREVFIQGEAHHVALIKKLLKGYYFLNLREGRDLGAHREDQHFVVFACDFLSVPKMQEVAKFFERLESPLLYGLLYIVQPNELSREQLLFAQELGIRYVAAGPGKNDELKEQIKRVCIDTHQVGSLEAYELEIEAAYKAHSHGVLAKVLDKLKTLPESEDGLRLMAITAMHLNGLRRAEGYLRRMLMLNNQNLWAANTLGKLFLRSGKAAQGVEVLSKLSQFHELNSERNLALGNAYVQTGDVDLAEQNFKKGETLTAGADRRFKEGLAKVKLAERDYEGALTLLSTPILSEDVISFLNMRAIMSMRGDRFDEAMEYYKYALRGAGEDKDVQAKLNFNMGLAYVRTMDLDKAQECFRDSLLVGGPRFQRAKGPLEIVVSAIKNKDKVKKGQKPDKIVMEDVEWETLY